MNPLKAGLSPLDAGFLLFRSRKFLSECRVSKMPHVGFDLYIYDKYMRKITGWPIWLFLCWWILIGGLSLTIAEFIGAFIVDLHVMAIICILCAFVCFVALAVISLRFWLRFFSFGIGPVEPGSLEEKYWMVYQLAWMFWFHPILLVPWLPVPLSRLVLISLGAKIGDGSYSAGHVYDPHLVCIGQNSMIGGRAAIVPHVVEGSHLEHDPIHIGSDVTIGMNSIIMAGVKIGDRSSIAAMSVVLKKTQIGDNEVWGGIPARRIR
jgi:serine acetyltransferase